MNSSSSWEFSISFSDRLTIINKIVASYKSAFPRTSTPEAQAHVRSVESMIFKDALSKEDYLQRCNDKCDEFNHQGISPDENRPSESQVTAEIANEPGQTVGPFANCVHHATGLFSTVYKTTVTTSPNSKTLALKLTTPSQCLPPHDPKREARILLSAQHPNVIELLETHTLSSNFILVFPFQPLDLDVLLRKKTLIEKHAKVIIIHLFSALAHLHSLGIIHRDIKPSNILLASERGPAYLADFGIAWSPNYSASEAGDQKVTDIGTTCYRPPELLFGQRNYGCAVDLWAAGCVVAEVVHAISHGMNEKRKDWTLFDAGELGSELALVKSIFETLGTPNEEIWPEANTLPDWNKMSFINFLAKTWEEILPTCSADARDLVSQMVRYQSTERMSAADVTRHAFLKEG